MNKRKLLVRAISFLVLFFGITAIVIFININNANEKVFKLKDNINKVILGSSTTECAINDTILKNTYNLSHSADSYIYSYLKLKKLVLYNTNIDTLFLAISPASLSSINEKNWMFNRLHFESRMGDYYFLMDVSGLKLFYEHLGYTFYKSSFQSILSRNYRNILHYFSKNQYIKYRYGGYIALKRHKLAKAINELYKKNKKINTFVFSSIEIEYLDKLIQLCNEYRIKVIFLSTPRRKEIVKLCSLDYLKFSKLYKSKYSNIQYFDFTSYFLPDECYADLNHLNYNGSFIFTNFLKDYLARKRPN